MPLTRKTVQLITLSQFPCSLRSLVTGPSVSLSKKGTMCSPDQADWNIQACPTITTLLRINTMAFQFIRQSLMGSAAPKSGISNCKVKGPTYPGWHQISSTPGFSSCKLPTCDIAVDWRSPAWPQWTYFCIILSIRTLWTCS